MTRKILFSLFTLFSLLACTSFLYGAAPTISHYEDTGFTSGAASKSSASVSWNANDVLVVIAGTEGNFDFSTAVPTATGLTFVTKQHTTSSSTCGTAVFAVQAGSSGSSAVTLTGPSTLHWGFALWIWSGSGGVGNSAVQATTTDTVSLTPTAANAGISWGSFDFNAGATGSGSPTPTDTRKNATDGTRYTYTIFDLTPQSSGGAVSYGTTATGGPFSIVVLEIKAGASGTPATMPPSIY